MSKRPRVLHIVGTLVAGGVQRLILDLARSKELVHYEHLILPVFSAMGNLVGRFEEQNIRICSCDLSIPKYRDWTPYRPIKLLRFLLRPTFPFRLKRLVNRCTPDLIHTHLSACVDWQAQAASYRPQCGWVWTVHGQYRPSGSELAGWRRAAKRLTQNRFRLVAVSESVRAEVEGLDLGVPVKVIYSGVDLNKFNGERQLRSSRVGRLGFPEGAVVFGSTGRLVLDKGYDLMVEAAAIVVKCFPNACFVVAGEGGQKGALNERVEKLSLASKFKFIGFRDDVVDFLADLDVFVMPSRREGLGIALLEALAMGLRCVGTRVGGITELLQDGFGILADPEAPQSLAESMMMVLKDGDRVRPLAIVREHLKAYSLEESARAYGRTYSEVLLGAA